MADQRSLLNNQLKDADTQLTRAWNAVADEKSTVSELLNRLQAGDFNTFSALQYQVNPQPTSDFAARTDEGEHKQLMELYNKHGLGDVIYSENVDYDPLEELKEYL